MGSVAEELERAERVVENIEDLDEAREELKAHAHSYALSRIKRVKDRELKELPAVRVRVAATLLGLSVPTVHKWTDLGVLVDPVTTGPDAGLAAGNRRQVTTASVLGLRPHIQELQRLGRKRNLLEAVLARIEDEALVRSRDLQDSIAAMDGGQLTDITPKD